MGGVKSPKLFSKNQMSYFYGIFDYSQNISHNICHHHAYLLVADAKSFHFSEVENIVEILLDNDISARTLLAWDIRQQ